MRIRAPRRPWYRSYFPGWWAFNPGSGGGAATVQTDGVTIQGDGSAGNKIAIKQVETDATLTGAGTVASQLSASPLTAPSWENTYQGNFGNFGLAGANATFGYAVEIRERLSISNLVINVQTLDAVGLTDFGLYNAAGNLVADIGPTSFPATGQIVTPFVQSLPIVLLPGRYTLAWTANATTLKVYSVAGSQNSFIAYFSNTLGATAGGQLNNTIVTPPISFVHNQMPAVFLY